METELPETPEGKRGKMVNGSSARERLIDRISGQTYRGLCTPT